MATSYFPLIVDAANSTIDELPAGDDLNLAGSNIANADGITTGNITSNGGVANLSNSTSVDLGSVSNLHISGGTANYVLTTDGAGTLSWNATGSPSVISNGNSNVSIATLDGNVVTSANGNVILTITETGANINGYANITGNVFATSFSGEGGNLSNITAANITGEVANANYATYAGTVTASAQSNITSVGILDDLAVLSSITSNADIYSKWQQDNQIWINSDAGSPSIEMGLSGRTTAATPFIDFHSSIGSGDYDARIIIDGGDGSTGNANLTINSAYVNITGSANITSNLSVGNANIAGTVTLGAGGSLTGANTITANYFIGEGGNLSNITAGNITGQVANALIAETVTASAQGNITSVGTLTSVVVSGNIQSNANVITDLIVGKSSGVTITAVGTNQNINLRTTGTGIVDVGNSILGNLAEPSASTDAATKYYVDSVAQGLHIHAPALAATTANLATITGGTITYTAGPNGALPGIGATLTVAGGVFDLIDTVNIQTVGTRILVKNESTLANNGVYVYTDTTTLTRAPGEDTGGELDGGDFIFIQQGAIYADTGWVQTTENVVIGTSPVVWVQFSGAGTYTAGTGLGLTGTEFYIANTTVTAQSYGNGDRVASFTVNGQGQLTAASNVAIAANAANLTGSTLASGITTSSLTTVGTLGNLTVAGNVYTPTNGTGLVGGSIGQAYVGTLTGPTYLTAASAPRFAFGTGDFTVECWIYLNTVPTGNPEVLHTGNFHLNFRSSGRICITDDYAEYASGPADLEASQWYHVAAVRQSGNMYVYVNGVRGTVDSTSVSFSQGLASIGGDSAYGSVNGYISNFRVVKGIAVYTSNFTPSTTQFTVTQSANVNGSPSAAITGTATSVLTFQNSTAIDNSTFAATLTNNGPVTFAQQSVPFGGAAQGTILYDGSTWQTTPIETTGLTVAVGDLHVSGGTSGQVIQTDGSGNLSFVSISSSSISNGTSNVNIATANGNVTTTANGNATLTITGIGANITGYANVSGNITGGNLITAGNVYTPTNGTGLVGGVTIVGQGYVGSFNGTNQYLYVANAAQYNLASGAGNWTVECWFKATSLTNRGPIVNKGWNEFSTNPSYGFWILEGYDQFVYVIGDGGAGGVYTTSPTISTNTWYHAALVRNGNSGLCFLNGVLVATLNLSGVTMGDSGAPLTIGTQSSNTPNDFFSGYISGVRIVKGVAVYTGNFTVPSGPLTATQSANPFGGANTSAITGTQTSLLTLQNSTIIDTSTYAASITNTGTVTTGLQSVPFATGIYAGNFLYDGAIWQSTPITVTGNITANYFIGNGNNLSNITGANVIGNVANATYALNAGVASSANLVTGANVSGTVANATYAVSAGTAGTVTTAAQGNITSVGTLSNLTSTGTVNLTGASNVALGPVGNVKVTGGSSGQVIQTDGSGNLSFVSISSSSISNGNSNVNIPSANGNVNISAVGNANIVVVTGTGVNIAGTLDTGSGNINTTGNVSGAFFIGNGSQLTGIVAGAVAAVANGNSNVNIPAANGNITFSSAGNANIMVITGVGANLSGSMTIGAGTGGNITGANSISANYLTAANALTVTGNAAVSNITVGTGAGGAITGANSISANFFVGNGSLLTGVILANGNSNINIPTVNSNITMTVSGVANVVTITNTGVNVVGTLSTGTANITANYYIGNGALLTGIAATTSIANGNSNVSIPVANGNVNISAVGNSNVLIVTGTGANISGTANVAGNLAVSGSLTLGTGAGGNISNVNVVTANTFAQGNSNITIVSNANVNFSVTGTANIASITAAGIVTTVGNGAITSNAHTASGVATGNSNVSTITGNLGFRSLFTTYTEGNAAASATIANAAIHAFAAPNLAAANLTVTFTNAATMYIANGPVANTNATITNSYALMVGGNSRFFGNIIGTLANGNSNVSIVNNANINMSAVGVANVLIVTGTGVNVAGTLNTGTGNINAGNFVGVLASGNSNVTMVANANVAIAVTGANRLVVTATGANIAGTANITGNLVVGNLPIMPSGNSNITITSNANISMFTVGNATAQFVVATSGVNVAGYSNATNVLGNAHTVAGTVAGNLNIGNAIVLSTTGLIGNIGMRGIFTTYTDNTAAAASTVANAAIHGFAQPNISATNTTVTFTNAATFFVGGAPAPGTNATITNPYSVWVANGNSRFDGGLRVNSAVGLGYSSTVGAATQLTNRNTSVTVSNVSGAITLVSATTTANTYNLFTVTNTTVAATDVIILNQRSGSANSYILSVANVAAGSFNIQIFNTTAVAVAESPIINFVVFKT